MHVYIEASRGGQLWINVTALSPEMAGSSARSLFVCSDHPSPNLVAQTLPIEDTGYTLYSQEQPLAETKSQEKRVDTQIPSVPKSFVESRASRDKATTQPQGTRHGVVMI